jgi:hypothetical protein
MRIRIFAIVGIPALLAGLAVGQTQMPPAGRAPERASRNDADHNRDITYGRVKEVTAGKKVVVAIDNAPDKSYDLTDRDTAVMLHSNVKTGDWVKVTERDHNGKKHIDIAKSSQTAASHGAGRSVMPSGSADRASDTVEGRIKELNAGQKIVVDVDNAPDKSYDLSKTDNVVTIGKGLKVGDAVTVKEHEMAGKNHVEIARHSEK